MSLKSQAISPGPAETARIARAVYPKGNIYMHMRAVLGSIDADEDVADLFRPRPGSIGPHRLPSGSALSGERTLQAFDERLAPCAEFFMALFGRSRLPDRSTSGGSSASALSC